LIRIDKEQSTVDSAAVNASKRKINIGVPSALSFSLPFQPLRIPSEEVHRYGISGRVIPMLEGKDGNAVGVQTGPKDTGILIAGTGNDQAVWRGLHRIWGGEFGRTPTAQGSDGRDHNQEAFTYWLAGGGVKPGLQYGATDDYGYYSVENKVHFHDLHATVLHLLGLDHKRLTYRYAGRDFRLTDVHGNVVHDIMA
jgi:hypothetical protein